MKGFVLSIALALLLLSGVACTREKPAVATPTLVNQPVLPSNTTPSVSGPSSVPATSAVTSGTPAAPGAGVTPGAGATIVVPNVSSGGAQATATLPKNFEATAGPPPAPLNTPTASAPPPPASTGSGSTTTGACTNPYVVKPGEWAYLIARNCGITFQQLQAANPSVNLNTVRPGMVLRIPGR